MDRILILLLIVLATDLSSATPRCEAVFDSPRTFLMVSNQSPNSSSSVENFFTTQGRDLYYRIDDPTEKVSGREPVVLLHGLGDHSGRLNPLADQLLQKGHRVIRIDLHGHGRTLDHYLMGGGGLKDPVPLDHQVEDVIQLLLSLRLKSFILAGHSYGGGVASAIASKASSRQISARMKIKKMVLIAPFVMDLRNYYQSGLLSKEALWDRYLKALGPMKNIRNMVQQGRDFADAWMMLGLARMMRLYQKGSPMGGATIKNVEDHLEAGSERFMRTSYRRYFELIGKSEGLAEQKGFEETIEIQVESSIKATQGISKYSLFSPEFKPWSKTIETTIIAGTMDGLVPLDLLIKTKDHLENQGYEINFSKIQSGHLIPQKSPDEVANLISPP